MRLNMKRFGTRGFGSKLYPCRARHIIGISLHPVDAYPLPRRARGRHIIPTSGAGCAYHDAEPALLSHSDASIAGHPTLQ
jgi:hypothetical protein